MAATQTEKQQNDLNSSEKAQPDQHLNLRNTLMQNGTEKNNVRGNSVVVAKSKVSGTKNLGLEMSQYRQDSVSGSCPASDQALNNAAGLETELNQATDINSYPPVSDDASSAPDANTVHGYNFPFGNRSSYNPTEQHAPSPSGPTESNLLQNFGQFGPQGIRHGFPGSKQPMIGPRPPGSSASASGAFPQQQTRFMSGQSISQPTGPTPTLNQLLQSTNQIRYQNNYGHADHTPYGPSWQTQKPLSSYSPSSVSTSSTVYRTQNTVNTLSSSYAGAPPSSPSSYGQNDQQPGQGQGSTGQQQQASRQAWNTTSSNQHPPSSPGQSGLPPGSRQSPQPGGHSPGPGPGPGPGMPPSPQQAPTSSQQTSQLQSQSFPNRPAQPTTPNAHAPDTGDLTGQNSNDSSGGPAPGTPNSQGMRPTPSPTGSTGSRSLSPAVGQQNIPMPPRPSSSQSDGSGPTRMSHSPMSAQGNYQQHLGPSMHVHGYKMPNHPGMIPSGTVVPGQVPIYNQQYSQASPGAYQSRSQQYGPNPNQYGPVGNTVTQQSTVGNNMSPGSQPGPTGPTPTPAQYAGRPIPNHVPHSQFSNYQQNWTPGVNQVGQTTTSSLGGGANAGASPNAASPRPPQYLKQHLQHKIGFGNTSNMPPSPGPPQNYAPGMGPPIHQHNMGPPTSGHHHSGMGPPTSGPANMGPPNMAPPASSSSALTANTITTSTNQIMSNNLHQHPHDGPMPPPSSTPNSHVGSTLTQAPPVISMHGDSDMLDNNAATTVASVTGGSVTSVVTTGPDGTTLDEGSQQSTLSNASAASGEDPQCTTPKSRKNEMSGAGHYSHPATPQSTVPSPGAASMNSMHEEYELNNSPSWPRTPASPKTDSLGKLYEMDDSPDRRVWLDKLLAFMEERRTPITTCPTISKNPLDLFRLYVYVKERGGFMEVTKNKTWKDIAGMLGIGASSSAAYTLRKHYTKNLLAYECQFDRGGIDPQPIINQVEANSKKKSAKAASVPSPGSSNSQDSFPAPGSSGASMDGYGNFGYTPGPGSGSTSDYNSPPMQRPSSQSNAPSPHAGAGVTNHHGGAAAGGPSPAAGAADNINVSNPFDDVSPSPPPRPPAGTQYTPGPHPPYGQSGPPRPQGMQQNYGVQSGYNQYSGSGPGTSTDQYQSYSSNSGYPPATRPMYPPYGPEGDRTYTQTSSNMTTSTSTVPSTQSTAAGGAGGGNGSVTSQDPYNRYAMNSNQVGNYAPPRPAYCSPSGPAAGSPTPQPPAGSYTGQQEYYRSDQQQGPPPPVSGPPNQMYPNGPPNKAMPPPTPQPKRHPDFAKDQQAYAPYGQQRPQLYGWPNNNQYRGQYQSPNSGTTTTPQWNQGTNRSAGPPHNSQAVNNQWEHRYPPNNTQNNYQGGAGVGPVPVPVQQNQQWSSIATPGIGQSSPLRPPLGSRSTFRSDGKPFNLNQGPNIKANQSGTMTSSSYPQQPLLKREISFPPDSIEATLPVLYRRKRICRMDLSNVDAWRVMMCLRSGLLSETTYALDMLNILLFDDSTVPYFGLSQWPGLLDLLLEHFRKSLVDMFDNSTLDEPDRDWYMHNDDNTDQQAANVDLGAVHNDHIEADNKTVLLTKTPNYTHTSRKDQVIRQVERNEDIFIRDNHKCWDVDGDAAGVSAAKATTVDSWQLASIEAAPTKYILPCFQAEFNNIPFCKFISDEKKCKTESTSSSSSLSSRNKCDATKTEVNTDDYSNSSSELVNVIETQLHSDKKKRTNTLSDVISRIKKDSSQINLLLTQELKEKVKTDSNGLKINEIMPEDIDLSPKTTQNGSSTNYKMKTELDSEEDTTNGSVSGSGYSNEGPSAASVPASTPTTTSTSTSASSTTTRTTTTTTTTTTNTGATSASASANAGTTSSSNNNNNNNAVSLKLNIKDTAGTLKRRRMSDYEDECYTKDEASLCLLTDTQDSIAKRCVAISNILRNLTFIPGNEGEFAKNAMFLSLLGKLLLLYHEHPVRTQKIRNYDREEDADFVDSCSSLQGEYEWWWEFLVHIRENVLVSLANIAGHMDLSQYAEDVARPVLDGLLHWAICPSAHGQDPFPNVGPTSLLSPQRLALEALCKLCVTDSNVDLVIATPPFSRLERLCAVLTKHLCRSEDQVLREFSVNLLHYLAAADSTMARVVATQNPCVSLLVAFIEQAEQSALGVANQHGIGALRENPDSMGTSLDMLRRAAGTLLYLAKHPDNRPLFMQQEQRLLQLVMSQILDQQVAFVIARVLFHISRTNENNSTSTNS